ncbi:MAG: hypothetical protein MR409_10420 [Lachnospiraceae bacterium]|nr:hypothetical protein [Lachnospiraceae bacterium]
MRKSFALEHMKRFGYFAFCYLIYSIISIIIGIPYGIDIAVAGMGIVVAAVSTVTIKL